MIKNGFFLMLLKVIFMKMEIKTRITNRESRYIFKELTYGLHANDSIRITPYNLQLPSRNTFIFEFVVHMRKIKNIHDLHE